MTPCLTKRSQCLLNLAASLFRVLNAAGRVLLGEDVHEQLALVVGHSTGEGYSTKPQQTLVDERLFPRRHLALHVCSPKIRTCLSEVSGARTRLLEGLETCTGESGGLLSSDPISSETTEVPMSQSEEHVGQQAHGFH